MLEMLGVYFMNDIYYLLVGEIKEDLFLCLNEFDELEEISLEEINKAEYKGTLQEETGLIRLFNKK